MQCMAAVGPGGPFQQETLPRSESEHIVYVVVLMAMTSALARILVQAVGTSTEMELDRRTRKGLLFLSGLSPIGWQKSG